MIFKFKTGELITPHQIISMLDTCVENHGRDIYNLWDNLKQHRGCYTLTNVDSGQYVIIGKDNDNKIVVVYIDVFGDATAYSMNDFKVEKVSLNKNSAIHLAYSMGWGNCIWSEGLGID